MAVSTSAMSAIRRRYFSSSSFRLALNQISHDRQHDDGNDRPDPELLLQKTASHRHATSKTRSGPGQMGIRMHLGAS